jgi:hypothetical protein
MSYRTSEDARAWLEITGDPSWDKKGPIFTGLSRGSPVHATPGIPWSATGWSKLPK